MIFALCACKPESPENEGFTLGKWNSDTFTNAWAGMALTLADGWEKGEVSSNSADVFTGDIAEFAKADWKKYSSIKAFNLTHVEYDATVELYYLNKLCKGNDYAQTFDYMDSIKQNMEKDLTKSYTFKTLPNKYMGGQYYETMKATYTDDTDVEQYYIMYMRVKGDIIIVFGVTCDASSVNDAEALFKNGLSYVE